VSARITALGLEGFEQLPKHARRCVFWEVDPATLGDVAHFLPATYLAFNAAGDS